MHKWTSRICVGIALSLLLVACARLSPPPTQLPPGVPTPTRTNTPLPPTATTTPTSTPVPVNLATQGTGYRWSAMTSNTADATKTAAAGLNGGNTATDVDLNTADEASNCWEAAGVIFTNTQTIGTVKFVNGTFNITSGIARGTFAANLAMQYTLNGTTWQMATGWTLAPSYSYTNTAGGVQFAFTGAPIASVKGVRVVGQLTTTGSSSKRARVREVMAYSQQNDALPITVIADEHGGAKVLTRLEQRSAHVTLLVSEISLSNGAFRSSHRRMYRKHRHATK